MSSTNQSNLQNDHLSKVLEIINEIVEKTQDSIYIYRGESQCFGKVRSSLYRAYTDLGIKNPADIIDEAEEMVLKQAKKHLDKTENKVFSNLLSAYEDITKQFSDREVEAFNDEEMNSESELHENYVLHQKTLIKAKEFMKTEDDLLIRIQLQHYGCPTNLIDFTNDYLIALFFACCNDPLDDGRIILLNRELNCDQKEQKLYKIIDPPPIIDRVRDQRSVFVHAYEGYIKIKGNCSEIRIPQALKEPLEQYLLSRHQISHKTVYNDIYGFIQLLRIYKPAYQKLHEAQIYKKRGNSSKNDDDKKDWYSKAIESYKTAISRKEDLWEAFYQRAEIYCELGDYEHAILDYNKVQTHYQDEAEFFENRGKTYFFNDEFQSARKDCKKALELNLEYPTMAHLHLCQTLIQLKEWIELKEELTTCIDTYENKIIGDLFKQIKKYASDSEIGLCPDIQELLDQQLEKTPVKE